MKVLVELLVIVLLIMGGWRQSFREHGSRLFPNAPFATKPTTPGSLPPPVVAYPRPTPAAATVKDGAGSRDNSWLWDRTPLDRR